MLRNEVTKVGLPAIIAQLVSKNYPVVENAALMLALTTRRSEAVQHQLMSMPLQSLQLLVELISGERTIAG
jgi:hypothetical protein